MNNICIAGVIGNDCELRYLTNGDPVAGFSLADDQGKDKPTIWWRASIYGRRALVLEQYLTKGQLVTISGVITEREYTNKDGVKVKTQDVRVSDLKLQGGKLTAKPAAKVEGYQGGTGLPDDEDPPF